MPGDPIDAVFLNGTVGIGKSTVADALGDRETARGRSNAVIDLDHIRRAWPAPAGDPFNHELELANLRDIVVNFRAAGVAHFIVAGVIEHPSETERYEKALKCTGLLLCRLVGDQATVDERLRRRHQGDPAQLAWHLERSVELTSILDLAGLHDEIVQTAALTPREIADAVSAAARWS